MGRTFLLSHKNLINSHLEIDRGVTKERERNKGSDRSVHQSTELWRSAGKLQLQRQIIIK